MGKCNGRGGERRSRPSGRFIRDSSGGEEERFEEEEATEPGEKDSQSTENVETGDYQDKGSQWDIERKVLVKKMGKFRGSTETPSQQIGGAPETPQRPEMVAAAPHLSFPPPSASPSFSLGRSRISGSFQLQLEPDKLEENLAAALPSKADQTAPKQGHLPSEKGIVRKESHMFSSPSRSPRHSPAEAPAPGRSTHTPSTQVRKGSTPLGLPPPPNARRPLSPRRSPILTSSSNHPPSVSLTH